MVRRNIQFSLKAALFLLLSCSLSQGTLLPCSNSYTIERARPIQAVDAVSGMRKLHVVAMARGFASYFNVFTNGEDLAMENQETWKVEITNKNASEDYPLEAIPGGEYRMRLEVRILIPEGEMGRLNIIVATGIAWEPPHPLGTTFSPTLVEYARIYSGSEDWITTTQEAIFEVPSVKFRDHSAVINVQVKLEKGRYMQDTESYRWYLEDIDTHIYAVKIPPVGERAVDVLFRGQVTNLSLFWGEPIGGDVRIDQVLRDPRGWLAPGETYHIEWGDWRNVSVGDIVELSCDYHPEGGMIVYKDNHYVTLVDSINARIKSIDIESGKFKRGEEISARITVENTCNVNRTFYVDFKVQDPRGNWLEASYGNITLGPGESGTITLQWVVTKSAPPGSYNAKVAVWEIKSDDTLTGMLDGKDESRVFEVTLIWTQYWYVLPTVIAGILTGVYVHKKKREEK